MKPVMKILCAILLLSGATTLFAQGTYDDLVEAYIDKYKDIAIDEMKRTGIPASITLAQGIIESSAGQSPLATKANNHFGIKCHDDWNGETLEYDDDRKNECFRKYNSVEESFRDHSDFLKRDRYAVLFTYDPMDYKSWARGLKSCGYATNPKYAPILIQCVEDFDLHQWDMNDKERQKWFAKINNTKQTEDESDGDASSSQGPPKYKGIEDNPMFKGTYKNPEERIVIFNDIKTVTLQPGEALNEIATTYEIGMKRLMRYNDITDAVQLTAGDKVYLQPKRRNGDQEFHIVQNNETMFDISEQHGIQLLMLCQKNLMQLEEQPATGDTIFLKDTRTEPLKARDVEHTITVPPPEEISVQEDPPVESETENSNQYHIVVKGDTLYSLSKQYHISIDELRELNGLRSNELAIGDKLIVSK